MYYARCSAILFTFVVTTLSATAAHAVEATYEVRFEDLWTRSDHPLNYPSSAHFSPVVGVVHNSDVEFWSLGSAASTGVKNVAETGSIGSFSSEVSTAMDQGNALQRPVVNNPGTGGSLVDEIVVNDEFPLVTFLTMVAPSPDWFMGVHDLDLRSPSGPGFVESQLFEFTSIYDAGTEEGTGFSLNNPATVPQGVITHIEGAAAARLFVDPSAMDGSTMPPIARLTFTRTSQTIPEPSTALLCGVLIGLGGIGRFCRKL